MSLSCQLLLFFFPPCTNTTSALGFGDVNVQSKSRLLNIAAHFSVLHQAALEGSFYSLPCKWWKPLFVKQKNEGSPEKDILIVHCLYAMVSWHWRKNVRGLFLDKAPCKYNMCVLWHFAHMIIIQFKMVCFQGLKSKKIRVMTLNCTAKDTTYLYYVSSEHRDCIFFRYTLPSKAEIGISAVINLYKIPLHLK